MKETTIYVTKYALTRGIIKTTAQIFPSPIYVKGLAKCRLEIDDKIRYLTGNDFFMTEAGAHAQAEILRAKKIESWKKEIKKLKILKIETKSL